MNRLRELLSRLAVEIARAGDSYFASLVEAESKKSDAQLEDFLRSNELWGGSGSVADSAGITAGRATKRKIEAALIALGEAQLETGIVNLRTEMWTDAFRQWRNAGI